MIALLEDTTKKIDSYIAEHPINKKVCGKEVDEKVFRDKIIPEIKKTIFNAPFIKVRFLIFEN